MNLVTLKKSIEYCGVAPQQAQASVSQLVVHGHYNGFPGVSGGQK